MTWYLRCSAVQKRGSAAERLQGLRVRIQPVSYKYCVCVCVLSGRGFYVGLITRT